MSLFPQVVWWTEANYPQGIEKKISRSSKDQMGKQ